MLDGFSNLESMCINRRGEVLVYDVGVVHRLHTDGRVTRVFEDTDIPTRDENYCGYIVCSHRIFEADDGTVYIFYSSAHSSDLLIDYPHPHSHIKVITPQGYHTEITCRGDADCFRVLEDRSILVLSGGIPSIQRLVEDGRSLEEIHLPNDGHYLREFRGTHFVVSRSDGVAYFVDGYHPSIRMRLKGYQFDPSDTWCMTVLNGDIYYVAGHRDHERIFIYKNCVPYMDTGNPDVDGIRWPTNRFVGPTYLVGYGASLYITHRCHIQVLWVGPEWSIDNHHLFGEEVKSVIKATLMLKSRGKCLVSRLYADVLAIVFYWVIR